ncbi:MAG TPA: hypothetical protein VM428_06060 [Microlunatus sp.]|nr:hypothetical protein [Microlunatus sp.]
MHMLADLWNDRNAQYLAGEIAKLGPFEVIYAGDGNGILALCWRLTEGVDHDFTLFDLADRLRKTGWQVPAYTLPAHREDLAIQRILVRHDFSRDLADLLLADYRRAMAHLDKHPLSPSMTADEPSGFHH